MLVVLRYYKRDDRKVFCGNFYIWSFFEVAAIKDDITRENMVLIDTMSIRLRRSCQLSWMREIIDMIFKMDVRGVVDEGTRIALRLSFTDRKSITPPVIAYLATLNRRFRISLDADNADFFMKSLKIEREIERQRVLFDGSVETKLGLVFQQL